MFRNEIIGPPVVMKFMCSQFISICIFIYIPRPILFGDEIEKNEMGETCSIYEGEERYIQGFGEET